MVEIPFLPFGQTKPMQNLIYASPRNIFIKLGIGTFKKPILVFRNPSVCKDFVNGFTHIQQCLIRQIL